MTSVVQLNVQNSLLFLAASAAEGHSSGLKPLENDASFRNPGKPGCPDEITALYSSSETGLVS